MKRKNLTLEIGFAVQDNDLKEEM